MKIFLDDIRPCPVGWTLARTVQDAKDLIQRCEQYQLPWETISLDHDLGACPDCLATEDFTGAMPFCSHVGTGYDLLKWMIEQNKWPLAKPTVHSMNLARVLVMRQDIERYWSER